jgi:hypothetical protein
MLKYILIAFVFCIPTSSFSASKSFASNSLSMTYAKNEFVNNNGFSISKNALFANKLMKKKRVPIFGSGGIISFVLSLILIVVLFLNTKWHKLESVLFYSVLIFAFLGFSLSIIGLFFSELWLPILGLLLNGSVLYFFKAWRLFMKQSSDKIPKLQSLNNG